MPLRSELLQFTRSEKLFILFSMLTGFTIASEYAITRPASQAIFLTEFSAQWFPYVWLATIPLNFFIVYLYNRFLPKLGPLRMLASVAIAAMCINAISGTLLPLYPKLVFFHYAWKDIYILLMFKQLWSMIHSTIAPNRAKVFYGIIFGMGTLGSVTGSLIPGFFASQIGSEKLFFFTIPLYSILILTYANAYRRSAVQAPFLEAQPKEKTRPREALNLIRQNKLLIAVLLLVVFMQLSIALMEYQFNYHLERHILDKDLRTEFCGRLIGIINGLSAVLQFAGGFLMLHTLGVRGSHFLIPFILLGGASMAFILPSFAMIAFSFILIKSIDFSLFGIVREMLYLPLKLDEKFRAKAVIDVFAYRTSKGFASLLLLSLQFIAGVQMLKWISVLSIVLFFFWIGTVAIFFRKGSQASLSLQK